MNTKNSVSVSLSNRPISRTGALVRLALAFGAVALGAGCAASANGDGGDGDETAEATSSAITSACPVNSVCLFNDVGFTGHYEAYPNRPNACVNVKANDAASSVTNKIGGHTVTFYQNGNCQGGNFTLAPYGDANGHNYRQDLTKSDDGLEKWDLAVNIEKSGITWNDNITSFIID